ncbi:MAG: peptide chain release factor N(5)-glutamine methyltransferase [Gemmatimonadaceae bacterium]|nr:peptide chain release factor N(5)-glutamine methyltransferase [Gemmatimonadaceae bacterium]
MQDEAVQMLSVEDLVQACAGILGGANAEGEARDLVAAVFDESRSWSALHSHEMVNEKLTAQALLATRRRAKGMPVQYAVGKAPFRHLTLNVDERVLIPRPETESLVDIVLQMAPSGTVADVGTGSGAIAISLATEGKYDSVIATDVSAGALDVARENALGYEAEIGGRLHFREGPLLEPLGDERFDAIVSNPPYIAGEEMETLPADVRDWEPHLALVSGKDGLDAIREIVAGGAALLRPGGLLALEVDSRRAERTADILRAVGEYEKIEVTIDLTGRPRFVTGIRRNTATLPEN